MTVPVRHLDCILQKMPFGKEEEEEEEERPAPSRAARTHRFSSRIY
jgi:hypothetical protein